MKTQPQQPAYTKGEFRLVRGRFIFAGKGVETKIVAECKPHTDPLAPQTNITKEEAEANAQRIVKAMNEYDENKRKADMHDELVGILRERIAQLEEYIEHSTGMFDVSAETEKLNKANQLLKQAEQK